MSNQQNSNLRFFLLKKEWIEKILICCLGILVIFSTIIESYNLFLATFIPLNVYPLLLTIVFCYRWFKGNDNIDLSIYPTSNEIGQLEEDLVKLDALTKNKNFKSIGRLMTSFERAVYLMLILWLVASATAVISTAAFNKFSIAVNWFSITAFAIGFIPAVESNVHNRINNKINEVQARIYKIKEAKMENKLNQMDNKLNKLLNLVNKL